MKKKGFNAGLYLIIIGVLTLVATRIPSLGSHNGLLLLGLFFIVVGNLLYIRHIKHEGI